MTTLVAGHLRRSDLAHGADEELVPSDTFHVTPLIGGGYPVTADGLARFVDSLARSAAKRGPVHWYLIPTIHRIDLPELPSANLHFDVDPERRVAAASLAIRDRDDEIHQWMTVGHAGSPEVLLTQDGSNADQKRFPPESLITVPQLRDVVVQWAFGDTLPPPAVNWRMASEREVGWL
ncbi:MAG TPA: hypothetical protein VG317_14680 [Pseudonocardiaceae bacterium]|jgi:hypothetical protein|nr:hypothetical protein [Pseudonocardiaceae bacterium]